MVYPNEISEIIYFMVYLEGFEPPTPGFEVQHSIQLSYECKRHINYYNIKKSKLLDVVKLLFYS